MTAQALTKPDFLVRLESELEELSARRARLVAYRKTTHFGTLSSHQRVLMTAQDCAMGTYEGILMARLQELGALP